MKDSQIIEALERLGAAFPWDNVEITIRRQPEGKACFVAYVHADYDRGTESVIGTGATLAEALSDAIKDAPGHDPELIRTKALKKLREQIAKLEALDLRYPPYRPGTQLAPGALSTDIEAEAIAV